MKKYKNRADNTHFDIPGSIPVLNEVEGFDTHSHCVNTNTVRV